jgi:hypothetical protein
MQSISEQWQINIEPQFLRITARYNEIPARLSIPDDPGGKSISFSNPCQF